MCSPVETPVLVQSHGNLPESMSHSGPAQCDSRQTVPTSSSNSDGMFSPPGCLLSDLSQVASSQVGPICDEVQLQATSVSPVPDPKVWAVDALSLSWEDLDLYAFPPVPLLTNVLTKALSHHYRWMIIIALCWSNMPWFWDLVEMSSQIPVCLPNCPNLLTQPFNSNLHRDLQNQNLHAWRLELKISGNKDYLTKWQLELKLLKDCTRLVYEAKCAVIVQWCKVQQVDFHSPSVEQIADFLLHLFQDEKLQPSTIEGYRSAIADKVGNFTVNISKTENLNRLLDSFHRDRPKGRQGIPSWNQSLVLHQLTKAPFEPLWKASLKHF